MIRRMVGCISIFVLVSLVVSGSPSALVGPGAIAALKIGKEKQLFIDDYVVAELRGVSRVFNPAEKSAGNPILVGEKPWEGRTIYVGDVIYDDEESIFKMWYWVLHMTYSVPPKPFSQYENLLRAANYHEEFTLCYATSRDGIHWERPNLGLVEFNGSKDNNLIPPVADGRMHNYAGMVKDLHEADPSRRYKAVAWRPKDQRGDFGVGAYFSPDGLHWTASTLNPVVKNTSDVHTLLGWDDRINKYVAYLRPGMSAHLTGSAGNGLMRIIGYSTSSDFEHWSPIVPALVPDSVDPVDTQFYGMPVVKYEGLYLGFPWIFRTNLLTHVPQLAFSRDGIHFTRTPLRGDFIPLGSNGAFDDGNCYAVQPVVHGDKIWFFYTGTRWRGSVDLFEMGASVRDSIGVATLPLDGFASIEAGPNVGTLTTKPIVVNGSELEFNLEAGRKGYGTDERSSLKIELLDESGAPIPGFSADESEDFAMTSVAGVAHWRGGRKLNELAGAVIRVRFYLRNAKLYAFQFR